MINSLKISSDRYTVTLTSAFSDHLDAGSYLARLEKVSSARLIIGVVTSKYTQVGINWFYLDFVGLGEAVSVGTGAWGHNSVHGFENVSLLHFLNLFFIF